MKPISVLCALVLLTGCIDTSVESTSISLSVAGTDIGESFEGRGGVPVRLERADVVFGPLTLCAGFTAGALCDEALAEWRDAAVVNALDPTEHDLGRMDAITGTTRSYMYDHGIVSLLTRPADQPLVTDATSSLDGASVHIVGTAEVGEQQVPFRVAVPVGQSEAAEQGVPVVRSNEGSGFEHTILPDGRSHLTVRFDARSWLATANFASLVSDDGCGPGLNIACAGSVQETCDASGVVTESRDCAADGDVCARGLGCVESVELGVRSQIANAVRTGVEAGTRPRFEFSD